MEKKTGDPNPKWRGMELSDLERFEQIEGKEGGGEKGISFPCLDVCGDDGGDEAPPGFDGVPFDGG
jgi:hypothetical protein